MTPRSSNGAAGDYRIAFVLGAPDNPNVDTSVYWYEYQKKNGAWVDNGVRQTAQAHERKMKVMVKGLRGGTPVRVRAINCVTALTKY